MLYKEYTYSVLIVSSSQSFTDSIRRLLPENEFSPVVTVETSGEAQRLTVDRRFDMVLINSPLADDFGTTLALNAVTDSKSGVLMFVKSDMYEEVTDRVSDFGVFTLAKPMSASMVHQVLNIMYVMQERFRVIDKKKQSLEEKMREIRCINHAKWVLISNMNVSEEDAHKLIEKQAMDTRRTKMEVAEAIIKTYCN